MRIEVIVLVAAMALTTYLIRAIPLTLFHRSIQSKFARRFFHYIPYTVLTAMTFPAIFFSTGSVIPALVGTLVALILAFFRRSLLTVSIAAGVAAYLTALLPWF